MNMSSLHCCLVCLGAEVSEAMERAFGVVLAGRKNEAREIRNLHLLIWSQTRRRCAIAS